MNIGEPFEGLYDQQTCFGIPDTLSYNQESFDVSTQAQSFDYNTSFTSFTFVNISIQEVRKEQHLVVNNIRLRGYYIVEVKYESFVNVGGFCSFKSKPQGSSIPQPILLMNYQNQS